MKNEKMKTRTKYKWMAYALLLIFAIFLGYGIWCECCAGGTNNVNKTIPCLVKILGADFEKPDNGLLDVLGIIWTVTTGLVFFVIQYGYGKKLGLQVHNILRMVLNKTELWGIAFLLLVKLLLYGYSHMFDKIWLLFLLPIEGMVSLILVVVFLVCMTATDEVKKLIKEQIESSIADNNEDTFCRDFLRMAKGSDFDDNEECDKFVECILHYLNKMDDIKKYIDEGSWELANQTRAFLQIKTITNLVDNMYAATQGGQRMLYVMQQCMVKVTGIDSFKIYLLIRSLVSRSVYAFNETDLKKVLSSIQGSKRESVLKYVSCYLKHLDYNSTEQAWARILLEQLSDPDVVLNPSDEYTHVDTIENMMRFFA